MQNKPVAPVTGANQGIDLQIAKDPNAAISLDGKRVVVIGGATGIGFAIRKSTRD
jgi:hypothetical protein